MNNTRAIIEKDGGFVLCTSILLVFKTRRVFTTSRSGKRLNSQECRRMIESGELVPFDYGLFPGFVQQYCLATESKDEAHQPR